MKYALNHPWKFEWPVLAFMVGGWQVFVAFWIEAINYILVVGGRTHMEVILGFVALMFITNFGDFFFAPLAEAEYKRLIAGFNDKYTNFLRI